MFTQEPIHLQITCRSPHLTINREPQDVLQYEFITPPVWHRSNPGRGSSPTVREGSKVANWKPSLTVGLLPRLYDAKSKGLRGPLYNRRSAQIYLAANSGLR